jgi:hypothetical protein
MPRCEIGRRQRPSEAQAAPGPGSAAFEDRERERDVAIIQESQFGAAIIQVALRGILVYMTGVLIGNSEDPKDVRLMAAARGSECEQRSR